MLIRLWDEHVSHEFKTHDTEATLETMVPDAYVNHIPVMTGGYGREALRAFYSRDFIPTGPYGAETAQKVLDPGAPV